jgi:hypothetical protein
MRGLHSISGPTRYGLVTRMAAVLAVPRVLRLHPALTASVYLAACSRSASFAGMVNHCRVPARWLVKYAVYTLLPRSRSWTWTT